MEIRRTSKQVKAGGLSPGCTFLDDEDELFILGDEERPGGNETQAVRLRDGCLYGFRDDAMVTPVKAHVVIEEG